MLVCVESWETSFYIVSVDRRSRSPIAWPGLEATQLLVFALLHSIKRKYHNEYCEKHLFSCQRKLLLNGLL